MSPRPPASAWPPDALLLTAGVGSRLHPLTLVRAKPAVPLAGVPLITRILRACAAAGLSRVVLNLHHRPETIARVAGDGGDLGLTLRYSWEQPVLGSAGGPRHALPLLDGDPYLLLNGDTLATVDLRALWAHHHAHDALVTMALIPNPEPARFGGVLVDADGWITGFCRRGDPRPNYHFFSAQVVARSVFAGLPDGVPAESVLSVYPRIIAETPRRLRAFICDAPFIEVGTPADYRRVHERLAAEDGVSPWTSGRRRRHRSDGAPRSHDPVGRCDDWRRRRARAMRGRRSRAGAGRPARRRRVPGAVARGLRAAAGRAPRRRRPDRARHALTTPL